MQPRTGPRGGRFYSCIVARAIREPSADSFFGGAGRWGFRSKTRPKTKTATRPRRCWEKAPSGARSRPATPARAPRSCSSRSPCAVWRGGSRSSTSSGRWRCCAPWTTRACLASSTRSRPRWKGEGPTLVLVMERIAGETLLALIQRGHRWPEDRARALLEPLLETLDYLHRLSPPVIHRDIKPGNVMLRTRRPAGAGRLRRRPRLGQPRRPRLADRGGHRRLHGPRAGHGRAGARLGPVRPGRHGGARPQPLPPRRPAPPRAAPRLRGPRRLLARAGGGPAAAGRARPARPLQPRLRRPHRSAPPSRPSLRRPVDSRRAGHAPTPRALVTIALPPAPRPLTRVAQAQLRGRATLRAVKTLGAWADGHGRHRRRCSPPRAAPAACSSPPWPPSAPPASSPSPAATIATCTFTATAPPPRAASTTSAATSPATRSTPASSTTSRSATTSYRGELDASDAAARQVQVDDPVLIVYDPSNPRRHLATLVG